MKELYGSPGVRFFAGLLANQMAVFVFGGLSFYLVARNRYADPVSPWILGATLGLWFGSIALLIGLFWHAMSGAIFRLDFVEWRPFFRKVMIPVLLLSTIAAAISGTFIFSRPQPGETTELTRPLAPIGIATLAGLFVSAFFLRRVLRVLRGLRKRDDAVRKALVDSQQAIGPEPLKRIELSNELLAGRIAANPCATQRGYVLVGLSSKPWHDPSTFSWVEKVESATNSIREELQQALNQNDEPKPYNYADMAAGTWNSFMLISGGKRIEKNCALFPKTLEALKIVPDFPHFREALISILEPGSRIKPHRDYGNTYLTCQLGLMIPDRCAIRVGGEMRTWREGKCMIFDTSYEHEAWNEGDSPRVVLIVDFTHPEITEVEKRFLSLV